MDYPSEKLLAEDAYDPDKYTEELRRLDERDCYKRMTDRKLFLVHNLIQWNRFPGEKDPRKGFYTLENLPSAEMLESMRSRLTDPTLKQHFDEDMAKIIKMDADIRAKYPDLVKAKTHQLPTM